MMELKDLIEFTSKTRNGMKILSLSLVFLIIDLKRFMEQGHIGTRLSLAKTLSEQSKFNLMLLIWKEILF